MKGRQSLKKTVQAKKFTQSVKKATAAAKRKKLGSASVVKKKVSKKVPKAVGKKGTTRVQRKVGKVFTDARKLKNNLTLYERVKKLKKQMKQRMIVSVSVEANPVRVASAYSPVYTPKVSDLLKLWDALGEEGERYVKEKKYYPSKEKFLFPLQLIGPRSGGGAKGAGKGTSPKSNSFSGTADELLHIVKNSPKSTRIGLQDKVVDYLTALEAGQKWVGKGAVKDTTIANGMGWDGLERRKVGFSLNLECNTKKVIKGMRETLKNGIQSMENGQR